MTAQTLTLTDFLLARIAERETVARDMQEQALRGRPFFDVDRLAGGTGIRELIDPARVLAECEAKRRIVELHSNAGADWNLAYCATCEDRFRHDAAAWPCATLRALALPFADHPDYRAEWAL